MKVNNINFVIFLILFFSAFTTYGNESCVSVKQSTDSFCGALPNFLGLEIKNNCGTKVRSTFCYENSTSQWECMSDTVFDDEEFFGFMTCNGKGNYLLKNCLKGQEDCAFESEIPDSEIECKDGQKVKYQIIEKSKNSLGLKTDKGVFNLLFAHVNSKTQFSNVEQIAQSLCGDEELSYQKKAFYFLKNSIEEQVKKYGKNRYEACIIEHKSKPNTIEHCATIRQRIPILGVRG